MVILSVLPILGSYFFKAHTDFQGDKTLVSVRIQRKGVEQLSRTQNPILKGFYPDPSVCRVGDDFYIVNSTFAYFPGLPIFQTRDFRHFRQIGNVLTTDSQLPLSGVGHSEGLYAPTIRYHNGTFYVICTNISRGGNFIVTATNPTGPWSEPHWIKGADGIDPSIFFDEDGTCYYVGTHPNSDGERYFGDSEIYIATLDLDTYCFTSKPKRIWKGALRDCTWPEAPHLYRINGMYYLMIAEGGTGPDHAVTIARSESPFGPFVGYPRNPILTHRHLGKSYPVQYVGHGDLVQAADGSWYMVMLASRPYEGGSNLGRETFFARVEWEDGWPVVNPGIGKLTDITETTLPEYPLEPRPNYYSFADMSWDALDPRLLFLRNPKREDYAFGKEGLALRLSPVTLLEEDSPSYVCVRQASFDYMVETKLTFSPAQSGEFAGLALVQSNLFHIRLEYGKCDSGCVLRAVLCEDGKETVIKEVPVHTTTILLKLAQHGQDVSLYYKAKNGDTDDGFYQKLDCTLSARRMCTEQAGGFVGCTVGVYATSNGKKSENSALFEYLGYQDI